MNNKKQPELTEIELYGSPTTKELKKKHSPRPVGGVEMDSWAERTCGKAAAGGPGWARRWHADWRSHICVQKNREEQPGSKTDHANQGSSAGK